MLNYLDWLFNFFFLLGLGLISGHFSTGLLLFYDIVLPNRKSPIPERFKGRRFQNELI
jgi:hypothetical protein